MIWAHSPAHQLKVGGTYMVTCGTYLKLPHLKDAERLERFQKLLFRLAEVYGWELDAWAVMSNHYHFIGSSDKPESLQEMVGRLHGSSSRGLNLLDNTPGRKVWFDYWDTRITYRKSYLSRLNYVNQNPVKHGLVLKAEEYEWCSAGWYQSKAEDAFKKTLASFKTDTVNVPDDF